MNHLAMKKTSSILIGVLIVLIGAFVVYERAQEDVWVCEKGQWSKHGNPSSGMPTTACIDASEDTASDEMVELQLVEPNPSIEEGGIGE